MISPEDDRQMNARKGMSSDSRGTKTTAYFDKLDESLAASVSLIEWLIILEQEIRIKSQKFKWDVRWTRWGK